MYYDIVLHKTHIGELQMVAIFGSYLIAAVNISDGSSLGALHLHGNTDKGLTVVGRGNNTSDCLTHHGDGVCAKAH